ncbi:MAG: hypothetical protein OXR68_02840 [Alphaproteobacteria bacterium]|nr:hypothetical protein [Alphaproteobacteria bacterium]
MSNLDKRPVAVFLLLAISFAVAAIVGGQLFLNGAKPPLDYLPEAVKMMLYPLLSLVFLSLWIAHVSNDIYIYKWLWPSFITVVVGYIMLEHGYELAKYWKWGEWLEIFYTVLPRYAISVVVAFILICLRSHHLTYLFVISVLAVTIPTGVAISYFGFSLPSFMLQNFSIFIFGGIGLFFAIISVCQIWRHEAQQFGKTINYEIVHNISVFVVTSAAGWVFLIIGSQLVSTDSFEEAADIHWEYLLTAQNFLAISGLVTLPLLVKSLPPLVKRFHHAFSLIKRSRNYTKK